jgi:hypothetical protein
VGFVAHVAGKSQNAKRPDFEYIAVERVQGTGSFAPVFSELGPIFVFVVSTDEYDLLTRQVVKPFGAFCNGEPTLHILAGVQAITNDGHDVRLVLRYSVGEFFV